MNERLQLQRSRPTFCLSVLLLYFYNDNNLLPTLIKCFYLNEPHTDLTMQIVSEQLVNKVGSELSQAFSLNKSRVSHNIPKTKLLLLFTFSKNKLNYKVVRCVQSHEIIKKGFFNKAHHNVPENQVAEIALCLAYSLQSSKSSNLKRIATNVWCFCLINNFSVQFYFIYFSMCYTLKGAQPACKSLHYKIKKQDIIEWAIISRVLANTHSDMSNQTYAQSRFSTEQFMLIYSIG